MITKLRRDKQVLLTAIVAMVALALILLPAARASGEPIGDKTLGFARYVDKEAGVVCWSLYRQALSCLPLSDTRLEGY